MTFTPKAASASSRCNALLQPAECVFASGPAALVATRNPRELTKEPADVESPRIDRVTFPSRNAWDCFINDAFNSSEGVIGNQSETASTCTYFVGMSV